jgi:hypothetical protein
MHTHAIIASLASFALVAAGHIAAVNAMPLQAAHKAPRALVTTASELNAGDVDASVVVLPETIIAVPRRSAPKARTYVCGPVEANRVGGSQRTCEWR